MSFLHFWED